MNKLLKNGILLLTLSFCSTAVLHGQAVEKQPSNDRTMSGKKLLERYDTNKNGKLDPAEIEQIAKDRMLVHDRNKDGHVDVVELRTMRANSHQMPKQDAVDRAMARAQALDAARIRDAEILEKTSGKTTNQPTGGGK